MDSEHQKKIWNQPHVGKMGSFGEKDSRVRIDQSMHSNRAEFHFETSNDRN